ncbi:MULTISPECIES: RHS repeat-associated core domain-containing protein [Pseudomonas]|nr:hypothetical protein [Pseudomonas monteilii]MBA6105572.1 hypothetical protein [Pseudomonas monteilii]MCT8186870.1 hypothetical protein [Pseudomonas monteilii]
MDSGTVGHKHPKHPANRMQPPLPNLGSAGGRLGYSPYGYHPSLQSILGFNGGLLDPVKGNYLLGNGRRAFNPSLMRFISSDTMSPFAAGGLNSYAYCLCDPINRQDPLGSFSIKGSASRLSRRIFQRKKKGPEQVKSYGAGYITETTVHTKIEENFSPAVNKISIDQSAIIPADYVLIGYHGSNRPNASATLLSGLDSRHGTVMWYGRGFYVSPYAKVASTYAGKNPMTGKYGRIYGVYAKNFDKWIYGKHFTLPNREEMVIDTSAYKNVIVRREVKFPIVLSDAFEEFMKSPPDENWRLWSSSNM